VDIEEAELSAVRDSINKGRVLGLDWFARRIELIPNARRLRCREAGVAKEPGVQSGMMRR
jgi:hypothetical protein